MWKYIGIKECNEFLLSLNLIDCKDEKKYIKTIYSISNNIEKNYRIYKIKKHNGKYRTIYEPNKILKQIQKRILVNILNNKKISKFAKAYHKGIGLKDNAIFHVNKKMILKLDIKNFFENISFLDVYNSCFSIEYFPKSVGMLLTYLCTYDDHLTQGSPTSAYISNLVMKEFDEELGLYAVPFFATFNKIIENSDNVENAKACVQFFLENDKFSANIIKRVAERHENFMEVVNKLLGTNYTFDELLEHYKSRYLENKIFSSTTVLYKSKAFSKTLGIIEEDIEKPSLEGVDLSKIGRNDPCPCGSGKKFKKCCGANL